MLRLHFRALQGFYYAYLSQFKHIQSFSEGLWTCLSTSPSPGPSFAGKKSRLLRPHSTNPIIWTALFSVRKRSTRLLTVFKILFTRRDVPVGERFAYIVYHVGSITLVQVALVPTMRKVLAPDSNATTRKILTLRFICTSISF